MKQKMLNSEKLCLKWNDFQENLNSAFAVLRNDQGLADVTLICEDGTQIETHKVILASSSPFFMEVLKKNKNPHPLIYMRGLKTEALVAMMDFLYYGEANVNQENLDAFLGLAEELKLKGLTGSTAESTSEEFRHKEKTEKKNDVKTAPTSPSVNPNFETKSSPVALVSVDANQLDEQIKSLMTRTENDISMGTRKVKG